MDYYEGANHKLLALVPPTATRILDIGCAKGHLGAAIKAKNPNATVWGIELVPEVAREAKTRLDHVLVGDIEKMDPLPLPEGHFECVTCGDVLEHMIRPDKVLARLKAHLATDAKLLCCVPNIGHWSVIMGLLQGRFDYADKGLLDRTHVSFFTPQTLREMLWDAGFIVISEEGAEMGHPGVQALLCAAATQAGISPQITAETLRTYQKVFETKPRPDPWKDPLKMSQLLGPHIGKLGTATKRCSVVVVTYNSEATIQDCLGSVLPTLSHDDELIVVDNASSDGTLTCLEAFRAEPRVKVIESDTNTGFSRGVNIGLLASAGRFAVLLNPDTRVWPGWLESLSMCLSNPAIGAVAPVSDNVAGDQFVGKYLPQWTPETDVEQVHRSIAATPHQAVSTRLLIGCCLMLNREILDRFGLLEEACFLGADDLELSWRYRELGLELAVVTNLFIHHQRGASFASVASEQRKRTIRQSDEGLIKKLVAYYEVMPSSMDVWRSSILQEAMNAFSGST